MFLAQARAKEGHRAGMEQWAHFLPREGLLSHAGTANAEKNLGLDQNRWDKKPKPVHLQMKLNCVTNGLGGFMWRWPCLKQCSALPDCASKLCLGVQT